MIPSDSPPLRMSTTPELAEMEEVLAHFERLEAQFQKVREGLTHSHRLTTLGTLASFIAHEYNNILTPIISYAQLALGQPDDAELMRKAVEKALAGAERAAKISSSLLGFAREGDEQAVADVPAAIHDALGCLGRDPSKDGIRVTIDVPPARVAIAPLSLQQVVLNLVLNARKAMRRRGGDLRITGQANDDRLHLSVQDTGPGIPPEILDRLFEPFVTHPISQGDELVAPRGTGLGLCICRDLLTAAGGSIRVENLIGSGATFHLSIPLAPAEVQTT